MKNKIHPTLVIVNLSFINPESIFRGSRVCSNCGKDKDVSGGKTCSKGHFVCHSCCYNHIHCPLCGHTLR